MTSEDGDESMARLDNHSSVAGLPTPPVKPKGLAWLLSFLLRAVVMALVLALFFVFAGVAVCFLLILGLVGRVLRRRRRLFEAMVGPPSPESCGLSPEELRRLPCFSYCGGSGAQDCAVCLEGFQEGGWCRALPGCNHVFHRLCVDRWLENSPLCPICRGSVTSRPPLIGS
ncbi:RING-H2 finger protein ATL56-like [Phalaenopsis equestris]|uniref:RING-H2 finger protein ATL56-like n=1 Tax=Phalaenopsis equestris TaxID=78828 RepID=UPI0009E51E10|nr:RING-H2 finger protein ATL56-like [Phalaenopsis equestris]